MSIAKVRELVSSARISLFFRSKRWIFRSLWYFGVLNPVLSYSVWKINAANRKSGKYPENCDTSNNSLLAICPERFRGDLELIEDSEMFRILRCPTSLVYFLNAMFVQNPRDRHGNYKTETYFAQSADPIFSRQKSELEKFYQAFLPRLFDYFGVAAVLGPNFTMPHFDLLGVTASRVGRPYIILHREGLVAAPGVAKTNRDWAKIGGRFPGDFLIVQNEVQKELLISGGYVNEDRITALGCMRMDRFLEQINLPPKTNSPTKKKRLAFFSFVPGQGLVGISGLGLTNFPEDRNQGLWKLFMNVHQVIGQIAKNNPEVEVLIKIKWGGPWLDFIHEALSTVFGAEEIPGNLEITEQGNVHKQILAADVVSSYGSTTLLEGAIAGKKVIVPDFDELNYEHYRPYVFFSDKLEIFEVAKSKRSYLQKIQAALDHPEIVSEDILEKRREIFARFVSPVEGGASKRYIGQIKKVISNCLFL